MSEEIGDKDAKTLMIVLATAKAAGLTPEQVSNQMDDVEGITMFLFDLTKQQLISSLKEGKNKEANGHE